MVTVRPTPEQATNLLAPDLMARVRAIQIRTHRLVNTALSGGYRSTFRGQGIEFQEVRPYQPGDEVRSIDWNVTARTGETHVKTYAEERELTLELAVDTGPTMDFGSRRWTKREAAAQVAALLAYVAIQAQDRVGLTLFGDKRHLHLPSRKGAKHILRIVREVIAAPATLGRTDLAALLENELRTLHRRSLVFVISDFLDGDELRDPPWREKLARLALRHDVIAVRVVDPLEIELPGAGWLALERIDDSLALDVDMRSPRVRERWRTRADARRDRLEELFSRARAEWIDLPIGEDIADPLVAFFRRRNAMRGGPR
jgi:uncharacterized protein (DUF58 family)